MVMMSNKFPNNMEYHGEIYLDGAKMDVKERKEVAVQPITKCNAFYTKKSRKNR